VVKKYQLSIINYKIYRITFTKPPHKSKFKTPPHYTPQEHLQKNSANLCD